jgi:hypothetical protein
MLSAYQRDRANFNQSDCVVHAVYEAKSTFRPKPEKQSNAFHPSDHSSSQNISNAIRRSSFVKVSTEGERIATSRSPACEEGLAILSPCRDRKHAQSQM